MDKWTHSTHADFKKSFKKFLDEEKKKSKLGKHEYMVTLFIFNFNLPYQIMLHLDVWCCQGWFKLKYSLSVNTNRHISQDSSVQRSYLWLAWSAWKRALKSHEKYWYYLWKLMWYMKWNNVEYIRQNSLFVFEDKIIKANKSRIIPFFPMISTHALKLYFI